MPFEKGHEKVGGREKSVKTQVKDFIKEYPQAVEELMLVIYDLGIEGDLEACKYFIDRIKGKPKATLGIDEGDKRVISALAAVEIYKLMSSKPKLLEEGTDAKN